MKKMDAIIIVAVLLVSFAALALHMMTSEDGDEDSLAAYVTVSGDEIYILPLHEDVTHEILTGGGTNTIEVKDGRVRISHADCPGQECVHTGYKHKNGDVIACLPHGLLVTVKNMVGDDSYTASFIAMDTPMSIVVYGEDAKKRALLAEQLVKDLDKDLDVHMTSSLVGKLNAEGSADFSDDEIELFIRAKQLASSSGGLFDPTVRAITALWNIGHEGARIPSAAELANALSTVSYNNIDIVKNSVKLSSGAQLDLGGIAKGYAADKVCALLRSYGVKDALIALSGNIYAMGHNNSTGEPWQIGLQDPALIKEYIGVLFVSDTSVVTSGGYERYSDIGGVRYTHIFDPATGYPAKTDILSVTIVSPDSTLADAYTTALYVMGRDAATSFQKQHSDQFEMVLVCSSGEVYVSDGIRDSFDLTDTDRYYLTTSTIANGK